MHWIALYYHLVASRAVVIGPWQLTYTYIRLYQIHVTTVILVCIQVLGQTFVWLISALISLAVANHPLATRLTPTPTYLYLCELRVHCGRTQNQFLYRSYQALELTCLTEESRMCFPLNE